MENITKDVFDERSKTIDERFSRDKKDIENLENNQRKIETLSIQMAEMLKANTDRINSHETRILACEKRPNLWWDKTVVAIITAIVSVAINLMFK